MTAAVRVSREQLLAYRVQVQQLTRPSGSIGETAILDLGVQDTGPDGALWALALRGVEIAAGDESVRATDGPLVYLWTLRGAPHAYRRADLPSVAAAVAPFSDADAGKRILSAAKPLKAAGIGNLEALDVTAAAMRRAVTTPTVKGEVSTRLAARLPESYLRYCGVCHATHPYEMTFRLAAVRAGLELEARTSPPVLRPIGAWGGRSSSSGRFRPDAVATPQHDVVRAYLHLLGPATPKLVAGFLDGVVKDVAAAWPQDVAQVSVEGEPRSVLEDDLEALTRPSAAAGDRESLRLLGPYDLFLQSRDRDLLVDDRARAKALWPVLGRPGAVVAGGEVLGLWRPRASGKKFNVLVEPWSKASKRTVARIEEQAQHLAAFRGATLGSVDVAEGA
jgi:hypothetical protein